jgi:hypothetical protein
MRGNKLPATTSPREKGTSAKNIIGAYDRDSDLSNYKENVSYSMKGFVNISSYF